MSTVAEIEDAMKKLPFTDKLLLLDSLGKTIAQEKASQRPPLPHQERSHSLLDIPAVSVGGLLRGDFQRADLLSEMLEERF